MNFKFKESLTFLILTLFLVSCAKESEQNKLSKQQEKNSQENQFFDQQISLTEDQEITFTLNAQKGTAYQLVDGPKKGKLFGCLNGTDVLECQYVPEKNFFGEDSFTYKESTKNNSFIRKAKVTLNVEAVNDIPIIGKNQELSIYAGDKYIIQFSPATDEDNDELNYVTAGPKNGVLQNCELKDSLYTCEYTSQLGFIGADKITYYVADASSRSEKSSTIMLKVNKALDIDGDYIPDAFEKENGGDPTVGEYPQINLKLSSTVQGSIILKNTNQEIDYFNYQINEAQNQTNYTSRAKQYFIRKAAKSFKTLQEIAIPEYRFDTSDLPLIPALDPLELAQVQMNLAKRMDKSKQEIVYANLTLKLKINSDPSFFYKELKNLELEFFMNDHQAGNLSRVGVVNIREVKLGEDLEFNVSIKDIPKHIMKDSFLAKGELPLVKIKNFQLVNPFYEKGIISAEELKKSLQSQNVEMVIMEPEETQIKYIKLNKGEGSIIDLMTKIYGAEFTIVNDEFSKIEDLKSFSFSYLNLYQLAKIEEGKWFSFSQNKKLSFDEKYSGGEKIVLVYLKGSELGKIILNQKDSFFPEISGEGGLKKFPIATDFHKNSQLQLVIEGLYFRGAEVEWKNKSITWDFCMSNCSRNTCDITYEKVSPFERKIDLLNDDANFLSKVILEINKKQYSLESFITHKEFQDPYLVLNLDLSKIPEKKIDSLNLLITGETVKRQHVWQGSPSNKEDCQYRVMRKIWEEDKVEPFIFWDRKSQEDLDFIKDLTSDIHYQQNYSFNIYAHLESYLN